MIEFIVLGGFAAYCVWFYLRVWKPGKERLARIADALERAERD